MGYDESVWLIRKERCKDSKKNTAAEDDGLMRNPGVRNLAADGHLRVGPSASPENPISLLAETPVSSTTERQLSIPLPSQGPYHDGMKQEERKSSFCSTFNERAGAERDTVIPAENGGRRPHDRNENFQNGWKLGHSQGRREVMGEGALGICGGRGRGQRSLVADHKELYHDTPGAENRRWSFTNIDMLTWIH